MLKYLIAILIGSAIGLYLSEGFGGAAIRGTSKYNKWEQESDKKVKEMLKGPHSSKAELQEWWDTYHPKK